MGNGRAKLHDILEAIERIERYAVQGNLCGMLGYSTSVGILMYSTGGVKNPWMCGSFQLPD